MDVIYPIATPVLLFILYFISSFLWKISGYSGEDMLALSSFGTICVIGWPVTAPILLIALLAYGLVMLIVKVKNLTRRLKNG